MRILFLIFSVFFIASCTASQPWTNQSTSTTIKSKISSDMYSPELQKKIPSPSYGSGKHTITIFADFQCPACINFDSGLASLFDSYAASGMTTIVYKQFPLTSIHKNAYRDAIAALCAAEQWDYIKVKKALYAMEAKKSGSKVTDEDRVTALTEAGFDSNLVSQCLKDNRYAEQVDMEVAEWDALWVNGTPTILLDGKRLDLGSIFADMTKGKAFLDRVLVQ